LILDSPSVGLARKRAAVEGTDRGARYCEGYELDRESANIVPAEAIGHMLDREEVRQLIQELARGIPKRATAASVTRRGSIRTRRLQ
jgi:hypothetical protein